jgi:hypothetical protein
MLLVWIYLYLFNVDFVSSDAIFGIMSPLITLACLLSSNRIAFSLSSHSLYISAIVVQSYHSDIQYLGLPAVPAICIHSNVCSDIVEVISAVPVVS